jgi:hypothetical protein
MLALSPPSYGSAELYDATVATIHHGKERVRFEVESINVKLASDAYAIGFATNSVVGVGASSRSLASISDQEMRRLYTYRLRGSKYDTRDYYDAILLSSNDDVCPYCAERRIGTIDHYLPQASYSSLSVSAINLVPCCSDCNRLKNAYEPTGSDPALLHPYFDSIDSFKWLTVRFESVMSKIPKAIYEVDLSALPVNLRDRVKVQFELLNLATLYKSHASQKLRGLARRLPQVHAKGGVGAVRRHLNEAERNCSYDWRNAWERVLYSALVVDEDYCESRC